MIDEALIKLQQVTKVVITHMQEAGVEVDRTTNQCKFVVFSNPQGVAIVEKYLTSAPVNIYTLANLLLAARKTIGECIDFSRATDQKLGLESPSPLTEALRKIYEDQEIANQNKVQDGPWEAQA